MRQASFEAMHTSGKHRKEDPSPQAQNSSTNSPTSLPVFKGTVRRAKIEDADRIVKHIAAVVATVPENDYIDLKDNELTLSPLPENLKDQRAVWMNHGNPETVRGLIRNPNVYFVVIEDPSGGIVGIGTLDLSTAIISNVYCKRSRGFGTVIEKELENEARRCKLPYIWLWSIKTSNALTFWRKHSFERCAGSDKIGSVEVIPMIKYLKESGKTLEPYRLLDVRERKLFKDAEDKLNVVLRGHQANENSNQRLLALAPVLSNIFLPTHATEIAAIAVGYAHQELDKIVEFSSELLDQPGETRATALVKMASKAYLINRSTVERIPNPPMEIKDLISLGADIIRLRANILADRGDSRASQHLGEVNLPKVESENDDTALSLSELFLNRDNFRSEVKEFIDANQGAKIVSETGSDLLPVFLKIRDSISRILAAERVRSVEICPT